MIVDLEPGQPELLEQAAAKLTDEQKEALIQKRLAAEAAKLADATRALVRDPMLFLSLKDAQDAAAAQLKLSEELTRDRDALRSRAEDAERGLAQRDEDLRQQGRSVAAAERANQEVQVVAELESRRLRAEKELRIAAEKQVQQLLIDLEALAGERRLEMTDDGMAALFGKRADILAAELAAVRTHRDEIDAERELLAARILRLMAPGQYLAHASRQRRRIAPQRDALHVPALQGACGQPRIGVDAGVEVQAVEVRLLRAHRHQRQQARQVLPCTERIDRRPVRAAGAGHHGASQGRASLANAKIGSPSQA